MITNALRRHPRITATVAAAIVLGMVIADVVTSWPSGAPVRPESPVAGTKPGTGEIVPVVPDIDLAGLRWVNYHGYELPVSAQAGPRDTSGGLASGYADSPLGALLAAVNIGTRTSWQFGPQVFQPTIEDQVTGFYQADMQSADAGAYDQGGAQVPAVQAYARQVAFAYEGYTPADATVDVVTGAVGAGGAAVYVATRIQVEWLNDDWRVVAPPGGDWGNSAAQVTSPAGYVAFAGQAG